MKNILSLVVGALLLAGSAYAQGADAAGTWDVTFTTPNGPMAVSLTLKKDGEKLTGSIAGPQGEVAVQGTQKDKAVVVNFSVQTPNGPFAIAMNGSQDGDAIIGTMDFGGQGQSEWSGKRRGSASAAVAAASTQAEKPPAQGDKPVDVTGVWAFQIEIGGGATGTPTVTFKQDGEKLCRDILLAGAWRATTYRHGQGQRHLVRVHGVIRRQCRQGDVHGNSRERHDEGDGHVWRSGRGDLEREKEVTRMRYALQCKAQTCYFIRRLSAPECP